MPLATPHYRPDLDGLRALAIVLVVANHYFGCPGGYIGVDIFFVISGYLITGLLLEDLHAGRFNYLEFLARRTRRIFPALLVVLATCFCAGWLWLLPYDFRGLAQYSAAGAVYLSNFLQWQHAGYFDIASETQPLLHLWSLAIEEQFYLAWPLCLYVAHRWGRSTGGGIAAILLASLAAGVLTIGTDPVADFFNPLTRLWELAAGGLLVWWEMRRRRVRTERTGESFAMAQLWRGVLSFAGVVIIVLAAALLDSTSAFPGYLALLPVIGTTLVIAAGPDALINARLLAARPAVLTGKISYSLYLWHWPVLVMSRLILRDAPGQTLALAGLGTSIVLAILSYRFIETPFRHLRVTPANAFRFLGIGIVSCLSFATLADSFSSGALVRDKDAGLITRVYEQNLEGCSVNGAAGRKVDVAAFAPCEMRAFAGRPLVILVGDSHSMALRDGLQRYLDDRQINLISYAVTFCAPLSLTDKRPACAAYNRYIDEQIRVRKPDLVIVNAHYLLWTEDPDHHSVASYTHFIDDNAARLVHSGVPHVLIVGEVPNWHGSLPHILNQEYLRHGQAAPERMFTALDAKSIDIDRDMAANPLEPGVSYFSVRAALCNPQGCLVRIGDDLPKQLVAFDYAHFTRAGSTWLMEHGLGEAITNLLDAKP